MTKVLIGLGAASLLALGGCATMMGGAPGVTAPLMMADGRSVGTVTLRDGGNGVEATVVATGLPAGPLGVHLHAVGKCEGPAFTSAGGHWNPSQKMHGHLNPMGPHFGDLGNLTVGAGGSVRATKSSPGTRLRDGATPLLDADGTALVIHAMVDDEKTDPSGNSGDRIVCAAFVG